VRRLFPVVFSVALFAGAAGHAQGMGFSLPGSWETSLSYVRSFGPDVRHHAPGRGAVGNGGARWFAPPGLDPFAALSNLPSSQKDPPLRRIALRGGYSFGNTSVIHGGSRLTLRPSLIEEGLFAVQGVYAVGGDGRDLVCPINEGTSPLVFPGSPPFDRYYELRGDAIRTESAPVAAWEQLWMSVGPSPIQVWVGTRDLPSPVKFTVGTNAPKDMAAVAFWHSESGWRGVVGTGASPSANRPNDDMARPVPFGPPLLLAYTGLYTAVTAVFAAVYTVISGFKRILSGGPRFDEKPSWAARDPWETNTKTSDSSSSSSVFDLPFPIFDIGYDYSARMGNRKPFHFFTFERVFDFVSAGGSVLWYANLNRSGLARNAEAAKDGTTDYSAVLSLFVDYNDGSFLGNAHYSLFNWDVYPANTPHEFHRGYQLFAELGGVVGPLKGTFMGALSSGRRERTSLAGVGSDLFPISASLMEPYDYLMFRTYGGGNQTFEGPPGRRQGMMSDAYALGARLDWCVAANLNVWTSYLWAHRLERGGTAFGQYVTASREASVPEKRAFAAHAGRALLATPADYGHVSNGLLGHEFNIGAEWRLLDRLTLKLRGSGWRPGEWFREAQQTIGYFTAVQAARPPMLFGLSGALVFDF